MPLYHWRSQAMAQYSSGHIIVEAPDPETARGIAISIARTKWMSDRFDRDYPMDDDDKAELQKFKQKVAADLSKKPEVTFALFINGSE